MADMREAVRLLIWDLDEASAKGALLERGISAYVRKLYEVVTALARRGIMSSICSENDIAPVREFLIAEGTFDRFIFPAINRESRGMRIASILKASGLCPAAALYVSDDPDSRAEAAAAIWGLQVADETSILSMSSSPAFSAKDDRGLTTLKRYKALERRRGEESEFVGDNDAFVKSCNIRVHIEHDIVAHLDEAIEMVNSTGALNFTKRRLPQEPEEARAVLMAEISHFFNIAGLVRITDKYCDYGFVGFFLKAQGDAVSRGWLLHYCFSGLALGTKVESWLYEHIGRPGFSLGGDVAVDLWGSKSIDGISLDMIDGKPPTHSVNKVPEIRIFGGCESNILSYYLAYDARKLRTEASFPFGRMFVRVNSASILFSAQNRSGPAFMDETKTLGLPYEAMISGFFDEAEPGSVLIYAGHMDYGYVGYEHKQHGWHIKIEPEEFWGDLTLTSDDEIEQYLGTRDFDLETTEHIRHVSKHVRSHYVSVFGPRKKEFLAQMELILNSVPKGSHLIVLIPDNRVRTNGVLEQLPAVDAYIDRLVTCFANKTGVSLIRFQDSIADDDEVSDGWFHYDRMVYARVAEAIRQIIHSLPKMSLADLVQAE